MNDDEKDAQKIIFKRKLYFLSKLQKSMYSEGYFPSFCLSSIKCAFGWNLEPNFLMPLRLCNAFQTNYLY
jgi:hypothetical protein